MKCLWLILMEGLLVILCTWMLLYNKLKNCWKSPHNSQTRQNVSDDFSSRTMCPTTLTNSSRSTRTHTSPLKALQTPWIQIQLSIHGMYPNKLVTGRDLQNPEDRLQTSRCQTIPQWPNFHVPKGQNRWPTQHEVVLILCMITVYPLCHCL